MLNFSKQGSLKVLDFNWNLSPGKPLKTAIFMKRHLKSTWNCTRYYSLRWKAVSRYQYTVRFVVKPLIVLVLYCSVFNCMCCSFCFHLGTHIKSCALHCTVVIYKRKALASSSQQLSPQTLPLHMLKFGLLNVQNSVRYLCRFVK